MRIDLSAALLLAIIVAPAAFAEQGRPQLGATTTDLVGADQELGASQTVRPEDLPAPGATPSSSTPPLPLPFHGQAPRVPAGFTATLFAKLTHPRRLLVLP